MRAALDTLVSEGLIERSPGRGTVVSPRLAHRGAWGVKSINDLIGEFNESQLVVLKRAIVPVKSFPEVGALFSLRPSGSLFHVQRVIHINGAPAALHNLFTLVAYAARLPKEEIGYVPLISQIEAHCRIRAARTRQVATATAASSLAAKLLGVRSGTPMLTLRRTYMNSDDEPIEFTELICRPDRYQHTVDFLREKPDRAKRRKD
jgi:GntR family transcriptional regulator